MADAETDGGPLPRTFGPYTLAALLGRGGMGEVFLAMRGGIEGINRRCVIKTLRPGFGDDREYVTRFLDEARVVAQLLHRNICPVFDVGKIDGRYYLAMEYIAGRDLRTVGDRLAAAGKPLHGDHGLALHIVCESLLALDYAHALQDAQSGDPLYLVHRDVSPHNVMIGFDGDVRLIDFGLAASTLKVEQTAPNVVMGKVSYMSPEQICGDPLDASADQFAAAIMATELLTGERFYGGMLNRELYAVAATGGYFPKGMSALPEELQTILRRAMAPERTARYPSCDAFRQALDTYRYQQGLRGDGPALRTLLREAFATDIVADRALLSMAATSVGLPPNELHTQSSLTSPPSMVSDTVPHSRPHHLADLAPNEMTVASVSQPRAVAPPSPAPAPPMTQPTTSPARRLSVGVVVIVLLVMVAVSARRIGRVVKHHRPPPETPVVVAHVDPPETPLEAPPVGVVETPVEPELPTVPTEPLEPPKPTGKPKPPPSTPVPTKKVVPAPPAATRIPARLDWLEAHCGDLTCTAPLVAKKTTWATAGSVVAFKEVVNACVDRCVKPTK